MNKITKEKRNQLIMVIAGVAVVLAGLYWWLIRGQYDSLTQITHSKGEKVAELQRRSNTMKLAMGNSEQDKQLAARLAQAEADIATGDYYAWSYDLVRRFKANYKVEIPSISEPVVSEVDLIPNFPYRQIDVTVGGKAYYQDLGKFLADFENTYPHIRVRNLYLEPANATGGADAEKLSFHFEIVALVKPNT